LKECDEFCEKEFHEVIRRETRHVPTRWDGVFKAVERLGAVSFGPGRRNGK